MENILKTSPAVFAVENEYQIMVPVNAECVMWVVVGGEEFFDDSNGILRSDVTLHRMTVPKKLLETAGEYTLCWRKIIERKPYFSELEDISEKKYSFRAVGSGNVRAYHIADAHNKVEEPIQALRTFEEKYGKIDFLILNGDVPDHSGEIENFDNIYKIISLATGGEIPTVFSRGNHDMRGLCAEKLADYTPTDRGNSYYTFRLGGIWGVLLDCGEDKTDDCDEYGYTICCHAFRKRETRFLKELAESGQFNENGVTHKLVINHVPFTRRFQPPFNIEEDTYTEWARILKTSVKPDVMICGHMHSLSVDEPGCEYDDFGQPCTVVVGSDNKPDFCAGTGYIFEKDRICAHFTYSDGRISENFINI